MVELALFECGLDGSAYLYRIHGQSTDTGASHCKPLLKGGRRQYDEHSINNRRGTEDFIEHAPWASKSPLNTLQNTTM